jgi:hypothetical protein
MHLRQKISICRSFISIGPYQDHPGPAIFLGGSRAIRRYSSLEGIAWAAGNGYAMALRWQARALRFQ